MQEIQDLQREIQVSQSDVRDITDQSERQAAELLEARKRIQSMSEQIAVLSDELKDAVARQAPIADESGLRAQLQAAQDQVDQLTAAANAHEVEVRRLNGQIEVLTDDLANHRQTST
eukprot:756030_1